MACGERGIRTPGPVTVNGFQDRRDRPLRHLSNADANIDYNLQTAKLFYLFLYTIFKMMYPQIPAKSEPPIIPIFA